MATVHHLSSNTGVFPALLDHSSYQQSIILSLKKQDLDISQAHFPSKTEEKG